MRPKLLKIAKGPNQSFSVRHDLKPFMENKLHYHPELELIYFKKGRGTQFIGDNISDFKSGDLVLVGAHLPHYWRFDTGYIEGGEGNYADVKVAHFTESLFGEYFLNLPENRLLKQVLQQAARGMRLRGNTSGQIATMLNEMLDTEGTDRIILLMQALLEIARSGQMELLSSEGYLQQYELREERLRDVYAYTYSNYKKKIQLEEIAGVARISPTSFCRYFKSLTQKTYSQFLSEVRVGKACQLLINHSMDIKQVCYESGFNNFASFHKSFKLITGKSPLTYQKLFNCVR